MKVLDLFSGLGGWSSAFLQRGHSVTTVDIEPRFKCSLTADVLNLKAIDLGGAGTYDLILASPPCEAFSVASLGHHWMGGKEAYVPRTDAARKAIVLTEHTVHLIRSLAPKAFLIENPRGMMRKLQVMQPLDRRTITYCQYGETRMKPTDLWGGFPSSLTFRPMCKNGDPCHERAPRGAKTGTQGIKGAAARAVIPYRLSEAVCLAMEASC